MRTMNKARYLAGPAVRARVLVWGELRLLSPARLGDGDDPVLDHSLLRDPESHRPLLTGTTLAGVLRSALAERRGQVRAECCWGASQQDAQRQQSRLIVDDALAPETATVDVRTGVALQPESGTALPHHLYDMELLSPGTTFPIRLEAALTGSPAIDAALLEGLVDCCALLEAGDLAVGAGTRRGFGRVGIVAGSLRFWRFDLSHAAGLAEWLAYGILSEPRSIGQTVPGAAALATALGLDGYSPPPPRSQTLSITLHVNNRGSLLIRSPAVPSATEDGTADHVHLTRHDNGKDVPVLPATSLKGVLRAHARRIAYTLAPGGGRAPQLEESLFGSRDDSRPQAGRVWMDEVELEGARTRRHTRVAVSRWTGGALPSRLFTSDAVFGGHATVHWEVRDCQRQDLGWMALVLKDWWIDGLVMGGETGTGRGVLGVDMVRLCWQTPVGAQQWVWRRPTPEDRGPETAWEGDLAALEDAVCVFRQAVGKTGESCHG